MHNQTDAGNAHFFSQIYRDKLRFDHRQRRWLIWDKHWWRPDSNGEVTRLALAALRQRRVKAEDIDDLTIKSKEIGWTLRSEQQQRINAMVQIAQNIEPLADGGDGWDDIPNLLGAMNGVVDLRKGKLIEGKPGQKITKHCPVPYLPKAPNPLWLSTLSDIFGGLDLIEYFHSAIGYSITGETKEQCLFCLFGQGSNGKSTLTDAIVKTLGPYAYTMPFSTLEFLNRSAISNDVANLAGKRFVVASETQENIRLNEGRIKSLTGDREMTARFLHKEYFTFTPVGKFWLSFNHKPRTTDDTHGYWRRIRLVALMNQFGPEKCDPDLPSKLERELEGILAWIVEGARNWYREGLKTPQWVIEETAKYRAENNPLLDFFDDRLDRDEKSYVLNTQLWGEYLDWARSVGEKHHLGRKTFSQRLIAMGFKDEVKWVGTSSSRIWWGIKIRRLGDPSEELRQPTIN